MIDDTYPLFFNNLHAVSNDLGNINKAISYLLPSDSKKSAEQATDAAKAGFQPKKFKYSLPSTFCLIFLSLHKAYLQIAT